MTNDVMPACCALCAGSRLDYVAGVSASHDLELRVRYAETDQMGVVYHSNYFPYFESARAESIRELGFTYADMEKLGVIMPVVAFARGSMAEVVDDGVTGRLVRTVEQAVAAVGRIGDIDRAGCRERAASRFDARRMVDDYLAVYAKLARTHP